MSLTINNTPVAYASIHGDLVYTVYNAANVGIAGYKYVIDVYVNGTMVARSKSFPNPVNLNGIFNIAPIVRNYIATQLSPTASALRCQELLSGSFFLDVVVKVGEEYTGTLYTNLLVDSSRRYYNHYNGRLLANQTLLSSFTDLVASNRPYQNNVMLTDGFCFLSYFPTTAAAVTIQVKSYSLSTGLIASNSTTITPTGANYLQILNVAPVGINSAFGGMIAAGVDYYTVQVGTSTYRFNVTCEGKFTPYILHFLNQFGGFESLILSKISKTNVEVTRSQFSQLPYRVDAYGVVSWHNSNKVLNDIQTSFATGYIEKMVLNTDVLTDAQFKWLRELILSPIVYLEMSGYLVPVSIADSNYDQKKFINNKLTNLTVNIQFGEQYNSQYR